MNKDMTFTVVLKSAGPAKIEVVKVVKDICGFGLLGAKNIVDGTPSILKIGVDKDIAESIKNAFEEVGAQVEIQPEP